MLAQVMSDGFDLFDFICWISSFWLCFWILDGGGPIRVGPGVERGVAKQIELLDHGARLRGSAHVHRRARGGIKQAPVAACADSWSEQIGRMLPVVAGPGCIAG